MTHHPGDNAFTMAVSILLAVILWSAPLRADQDSDRDKAGVVFLQLHIDNSGVSLIKSDVVPGTLKRSRAETGVKVSGISYEVESETGAVIASRAIDHPLIRRIEYEDTADPGRLRSEVIRLAEADFILRLGFRNDIASISFYETQQDDVKTGGKPTRKLLGKVIVDLGPGGEE